MVGCGSDFLDGLHGQEKPFFRIRERDKTECTVESMGMIVFRIDNDSNRSNLLADGERPFESVCQQQLANALPFERQIARQATNQGCAGNRVARQLQFFDQVSRQVIEPDVVGSEGIEPGDAVIVRYKDVGHGGALFSVLACLLLQVAIKLLGTARKNRPEFVMLVTERLKITKMLRRNRSYS